MTENDQIYSIYKHNASLDVNLFFCFDCRARPELLEPELLEQEVDLLGPDLQIGKVGRCDLDFRIQPDGSGALAGTSARSIKSK